MRETVNFLIEVNNLKETPRTGWVMRGIPNAETIADHTFGMAVLSWFLAAKKGLNIRRTIKTALFHDLCERYAGDITPYLYYPRLPRDKKKRNQIMLKWARLSKREKAKIGKTKFRKEKTALLKLVRNFPQDAQEEMLARWLDYERGTSSEGRFVNQINRIETLVQSIKYFGTKNVREMTTWWEWAEEIVEDPLLLEFKKVIQKKLYEKKTTLHKDRGLESILDFILQIEKLKRMPRLYWTLRGIKNPETVAGHVFTLLIMAWLLGRQKKNLNQEKLFKMALCHELSAVYTGDTTPYDRILLNNKREGSAVLKKMIRISKQAKKRIFLEDYREEKKSIKKLVAKLESSLQKEVIKLWEEYRAKNSPEAQFLSQLNTAAILFQGLLYEKKDKRFSAAPLWEWAFEFSDDPLVINFLEAMKQKFYGGHNSRLLTAFLL